MKSEMFLDPLGEINDDFILDAEYGATEKKTHAWLKWLPLAACLVVAVLVAVPLLNGNANKTSASDTTVNPQEQPVPADNPEESSETDIREPESYASQAYGDGYFGEYSEEERRRLYEYNYNALIQNPVFDAFLASEETQDYSIASISVFSGSQGGMREYLTVTVPRMSTVQIYHSTLYMDVDWEGFLNAENYGVRTDYQVDGIEIQKYYSKDTARFSDNPLAQQLLANGVDEAFYYWARININGDWYQMMGSSETAVDAVAATLAHIAAQY